MLNAPRIFFGLLGAAALWGGGQALLSAQQTTPALAQTNTINLGAVTTAAPTYVTGTNRPLSLTTGGLLRVDSSGGGSMTVAAAGTTAFDAAAAVVNPLLGGCYSSAAAPTDVSADNDATRDWCLRNGARVVQPSFAGVLGVAGNGGSGTGVQRVTIANDSTGTISGTGTAGTAATGVFTVQGIASMTPVQVSQATATNLNAAVVGTGTAGTPAGNILTVQGVTSMTPLTVNPGTAANWGIAATAAAPPANAVQTGAIGSGATGGLLAGLKTCDLHAKYDASDNGSITLVTGVSGRKVYICGYIMAVSGTATTLKLREGSDANCATNGADITPGYALLANQSIGMMGSFWTGLAVSTAAYFVCINAGAANAHQTQIFYTIQ